MRYARIGAALALAALCLTVNGATAATDPARATAPPDGWASQGGGTIAGANATTDQIYTVTNRAQLLAAIAKGDHHPVVEAVGGGRCAAPGWRGRRRRRRVLQQVRQRLALGRPQRLVAMLRVQVQAGEAAPALDAHAADAGR